MNTDGITTHLRELDELGYTVLKDLLTPHQVSEAVAALKEIYEREKDIAQVLEPMTQPTFNVTRRAEIFRQLIQLPKLVACMEYLLGKDYILSDMSARSPMPGIKGQNLHRDGGIFLRTPEGDPNPHAVLPISAQSMFALVEFTEGNGATRFVPRSHVVNIDPTKVRPDEEYLFTCPPGSVLVYDNRLIHGGGPNTTDQVRYSLQGFCCRSNIRPFCDHTRSIPRDIVENASPLMRRLWGFESQSMWEGDTPRRFKIVEAPGAKPVFDYHPVVHCQTKR